jgi:sulfur-carrier protein adenylyltransferase/sulfurtransferase
MAVRISIPTALRPYVEGQATVSVEGSTVAEALAALTQQYGGLQKHLRDDAGKLRSFVNVYLNDEDIRFLDQKDATVLAPGDAIIIVPSIAGGSAPPSLDSWEIARYSRHLLLEEVGLEGQAKLKNSSVACVGTGGLGSPFLLYMAAAGVGRIGIVDFDVVDESNLQRQVIHGTSTIGRSKLSSAKARILDINPRCQVDTYEVALASDNALDVLRPYDVVVDGTDNFPTRYLVNDACVILGKPNVYGSIFKFEGQASVFNYQGGPNYRDLYPEPPPPGLVPSCAEGGVLGILPGVIGCIQATEALKILLGKGTTLSGRLLLYDAFHMTFRELKLRKDPNAKPITELIDYQQFCGVPHADDKAAAEAPTGDFVPLSATDVKTRQDEGWKPWVLDVRRPHEADIVRLPFTDQLIQHDQIANHLDEIPRDRDILVYCKSGARSTTASRVLAAAGFRRLFHLEGGVNAWSRLVDPSLPQY